MKKQMALAVLVSVVTMASAAAQQAATAEGTMLRWKFVAGQKYDVVIHQDTSQKMSLPTQEINVTNNLTTTMTWVVESIDGDGIANVVQTIERVKMDVDSPQGKISYDSNEEESAANAGQVATVFEPMIGVAVKQTMNDRGEILDVEFPAKALEGVRSNPAAAQMMTPEALKDMTAKASPVLPEGPAVVGQVWSKEGTSKTPVGSVSVKNAYTYEGKSPTHPELELIKVDVVMSFLPSDNALAPTIKITAQDSSGKLTFDNLRGYLSASELHQDMTLQIEAAGQKIDQSIQSKTNMTVTPSS